MKQFIYFFLLVQFLLGADKLLIPMDKIQKDHLKAYGIAFWTLEKNINIEWLLNYRGGSFLIDYYSPIGPLSFSFAQPITKNSSDITETFRFNIGTSF